MEIIDHKKIAAKTLLVLLFALLFILIVNSWANIKLMLDGNSPPFSIWVDKSFKASNLLFVGGYGAYSYYRNYMLQRRSILKQKVVVEQNEL